MNKRTSALAPPSAAVRAPLPPQGSTKCALGRRWRKSGCTAAGGVSLASLSMRVKSERLPIMPLVQLVNVEDVLGLDVAIAFSTPNACRPRYRPDQSTALADQGRSPDGGP